MPAASVLAVVLFALPLLASAPSASASNLKTRVWDFFEDCPLCTDGEGDLSAQPSSGKTASNASDCGGRNLFYNRFRYYDPSVGRYISPDPIGPDDDLNVYRGAANTTGWIDPYGLANLPCKILRDIWRSRKAFVVRSWKQFHTLVSPTKLIVTEYHLKDLKKVFGRYKGRLNIFSVNYWKHVLPHHHVYTTAAPPTPKANMRKAFEKAGAAKTTHWLFG
jgi:RHS repeat-associated protein